MMPRPIYNMGNTCYLNSCLQILFAIPNIHTIINLPRTQQILSEFNQNNNNTDNYFDKLLTIEWCNMCKNVVDTEIGTPIAPYQFLTTVFKLANQKHMESFVPRTQNDASEFLQLFINSLHDTLKRPVHMNIRGTERTNKDKVAVKCYLFLKSIYEKEYSEIYETFYGLQYTEIVRISDSKILSIRPEHYFTINVDIPTDSSQRYSLQQLVQYGLRDEHMEGENAYFNEDTGQKENVIKRTRFWNYPPILVFCLKRFSYMKGYPEKIQSMVDFPVIESLDISKYLSGYGSFSSQYRLFGICNHLGNAEGGHYNSFVYTGDQWFYCDDTTIEIVPTDKVPTISTMYAYLLFYCRV